MRRLFPFLILSVPAAAWGQRVDENAVRAATDAFGVSVGTERIGLYTETDVRGFSPIAAGNIRLEGLYVDAPARLIPRLVKGSTVRVGIAAQGYSFPAPTGIVDYNLRTAGRKSVLSGQAFAGPYGGAGIEVDAQLPLSARLGVAGGISARNDEAFKGTSIASYSYALTARWQPAPALVLQPFVAGLETRDEEAIPLIFTAGAYLPPRTQARNLGPRWATAESATRIAGAIGSFEAGKDLSIRAGLFRIGAQTDRAFTILDRRTTPTGRADETVIADPEQRFRSTSGEVRITKRFPEGPRTHSVTLMGRARNVDRRFGGSAVRAVGPVDVRLPRTTLAPAFTFAEQNLDSVRQRTFGLEYALRWGETGQITAALQKTNYLKRTELANGTAIRSAAQPLLANANAAVNVTRRLALFGGYTRGLEESVLAPAEARNRNEPPAALRTDQKELGLRWRLPKRMLIVAALFDVRRPYLSLDSTGLFRTLGSQRHRGLEASLSGSPLPGMQLVAGAVLMDPRVVGEAVETEAIGPRPIAQVKRSARLNLDYRPPRFDSWSMDIAVTYYGARVASSKGWAELDGEQLYLEPRMILDAGARYKFRAGSADMMLRLQMLNVTDSFGWRVIGSGGFRPREGRRALLSLTCDL